MDQPKIERLLRLMQLLSGNVDYSIGELGDRLDMSPRTIYRYIDTLKSAGFAVTKLHSDVYKLSSMPSRSVDIDNLIYFSEEEAYLVNSLIDRLIPSNTLKANLKQKLSAIYDSTSIADYVDSRSNSTHVELLGKAIKEGHKVILRQYESGHSHSVRDRLVEPFAFTTDYVDVWAFDTEDGRNKLFKISRIGEVEITEERWSRESEHHKSPSDIFRMTGEYVEHIRLKLSFMAKNLLVEEFPLSARQLNKEDDHWILETDICNMRGAGRFVGGLMDEIEILEGEGLKSYLRQYCHNYLTRSGI